MEPLVSVVIPCYNVEKTILRALNSIDKCCYPNLEIIVVNDGSTDATGKIIDEVIKIDKRIKLVNQNNAGVSVARNVGVANASSNYVAFLDADDIYFNNCIADRMKIFSEEDTDDLLGVYCPAFLLDEHLQIILNRPLFDHNTAYDRLYFSTTSSCVFNPSSVIVKKSKFIKSGGFESRLVAGEDFDLWHKMMRMGGYFRKVNSCFIGWVQHQASTTHSNVGKHYEQCKIVVKKIFSSENSDCFRNGYPEGFGYYTNLEAQSNRALASALSAVILGDIDTAIKISNDINKSYLDKLHIDEFMSVLKFNFIKMTCTPESEWPIPSWRNIKLYVFEYIQKLKRLPCVRGSNKIDLIIDSIIEFDDLVSHNDGTILLKDLQQEDFGNDKIELLTTELINENKKLVEYIYQKSNQFKIGLGWHYILDLIWIIKNVLLLPQKALILDAGAGNGLLQFLLSDLGYTVISADFAPRTPPVMVKHTHRVIEVTTGHTYENEYIKHLEAEFKISSSGHGLKIADRDSFETLLDSNPPGTIYYYRTDISNLELIKDCKVDAVVSLSALEHNNHDVFCAAVNELCRVVRPDRNLYVTVSATDKDDDLYHQPSKGWCYSARSLKSLFNLNCPVPNFNNYPAVIGELKDNIFMKSRLSSFYFQSGNNGMPWGVWNPQYCPVGVIKKKTNYAKKRN
jgi:glycosyltransferase involved in cell wall biosynthesis/SAM-dependent methyltransferase